MTRGTTNIPVVGVVVRRDNKVLFVMRKDTGWMDGFYCLPGGHVDPNETFAEAACREAKEEVGVDIVPKQLKHLMTYHKGPAVGGDIRVGIIFEALEWQGEPSNTEPDKHDHIEWLDINNLPDTVVPEIALKMQKIQEGVTYFEFDWKAS